MAKVNFISEMANDLRSFEKLLENHLVGYLQNPSSLADAIGKVKDPSKATWSYEIPALKFVNLDLGKVISPDLDNRILQNAVLELKMNIACLSEMPDPIDDPIMDFSIQIVVKIRDFEKVVAKNIWRFELHQTKDKNGVPSKQPEFHHPLYHLHFGGDELNEEVENSENGSVLVLKTPRIMHPPMDIILAIDFVLNNFYSYHECKSFTKLKNNPAYDKIVRNSRERFWKPYAFGFASNFTTNHNFLSESQVAVVPTYAKNLLTYSEKH